MKTKRGKKLYKEIERVVKDKGFETVEAYLNYHLSSTLKFIAKDLGFPYKSFAYFYAEYKKTREPVFDEEDFKELMSD